MIDDRNRRPSPGSGPPRRQLRRKGQAEQQLPILHDEDVTSLIASLGRRPVDAIPPELRHSELDDE